MGPNCRLNPLFEEVNPALKVQSVTQASAPIVGFRPIHVA
jgi:hypothetical protein